MRDIRDDLIERLQASQTEQTRLNYRLKEIEAEMELIRRLVEIEMKRHPSDEPKNEPEIKISEFVLNGLRERGPATKEQIRVSAEQEGYFKEGDSPGRTVHAVVTNLARTGKIKELPGGLFEYVKDAEGAKGPPSDIFG
jgi:hypothetical protein